MVAAEVSAPLVRQRRRRRRRVAEVGDTVNAGRVANLYRIFEETVRRFGDRTAVEVQRKDTIDRYSYRALQELTADRASRLRHAGVLPGDRCAILAHNDAHWCAAYLAILAVGGVVVPFDTNYSAVQVATILKDSGARVLFTSQRLRETADAALAGLTGVVVLDVHADASAGPPEPVTAVAALAVEAAAPAVILYTSGTTSDPKGVVLSHANLVAERDAAFAVLNVRATDSVLGVLPLFHSLAQLASLLLPFAVGARVVYLDTLSSQELVRALSERQITIFACVPQFFYLIHERILREVDRRGTFAKWAFRAMLATSVRARRIGVNLGPTLFARVHAMIGRQMRFFVTGGSKFDPAVGRDLYGLGFTILQAYGLTETSGAATINTPDEAHLDTVGRPLPGMELKILAPEGGSRDAEDGEIALRGPLIMQGYFNRPDATAAVMREGWLLTGDLGRVDRQGRLTITGRKKEVIILANGKNLYPEEIEAHYRQSPFVKEVCVTAFGEDKTGQRLYGVVVPDMEALAARKVVNAGDLLRFELEGLSASLPSYKRVLGYDVWFEPLPRTTTGKLKRHEILRRLQETASSTRPAVSEADERWQADPHVSAALEVVRRRAIGGLPCRPSANLELDLGLDSMERVELLTELEQEFGVRVAEEQTHQIFTLGQLIDAVRPVPGNRTPATGTRTPATGNLTAVIGSRTPAAGNAATVAGVSDDSWAVLLSDLPPETDPVLGGLLSPRPILEPVLYVVSWLLPRLLGTVRVSGLDNLPKAGAFLICPNHQSYVDPFFVCGVLPYRTLARAFFVGAVEYFETPLMSWVARKLHCVPVDPDSNLVPAMKAGAFGLAHDKVLILFPEGERSIDGTVKRFKKGAPILSRHLGVPVVPVAIGGAYDVWPRGRSFNWRGLLPWSRSHVRIQFGDPIQFTEGESAAAAAARLRATVDGLWQRL